MPRVTTLCLFFVQAAIAGADTSIPFRIAAAVEDAARPANQVALDVWRKPGELIAYAGVKPGDRIADFMSGNGYFIRILSHVVGRQGRVYAFLPIQQLANCAPEETAGTIALRNHTHYSNVKLLSMPAEHFSAPELLDEVWIVQGYHDLHDKFMEPANVATVNTAVFNSLKPGGIYLIVDHVARSGSALHDTETLHRIDPATIRTEVTRAGFQLESESNLFRNPADTHELAVFDPAIRHQTDQIVLKFRKPRV
ncbi:MAG TPA: hypothetical protein VGI93_06045 [Steroidobacteraceae bacterium]